MGSLELAKDDGLRYEPISHGLAHVNAIIAEYLKTTLKKSIRHRNWHVLQHTKFSATIDEALVAEWLTMIKDWEADGNKTNPYADTEWSETSISLRFIPLIYLNLF